MTVGTLLLSFFSFFLKGGGAKWSKGTMFKLTFALFIRTFMLQLKIEVLSILFLLYLKFFLTSYQVLRSIHLNAGSCNNLLGGFGLVIFSVYSALDQSKSPQVGMPRGAAFMSESSPSLRTRSIPLELCNSM